MIEDTIATGASRPNTLGRAGTIFEKWFGPGIGTDLNGAVAQYLRVVMDEAGDNVITAFPF